MGDGICRLYATVSWGKGGIASCMFTVARPDRVKTAAKSWGPGALAGIRVSGNDNSDSDDNATFAGSRGVVIVHWRTSCGVRSRQDRLRGNQDPCKCWPYCVARRVEVGFVLTSSLVLFGASLYSQCTNRTWSEAGVLGTVAQGTVRHEYLKDLGDVRHNRRVRGRVLGQCTVCHEPL